jgi:hypothetical protein
MPQVIPPPDICVIKVAIKAFVFIVSFKRFARFILSNINWKKNVTVIFFPKYS